MEALMHKVQPRVRSGQLLQAGQYLLPVSRGQRAHDDGNMPYVILRRMGASHTIRTGAAIVKRVIPGQYEFSRIDIKFILTAAVISVRHG